MLCMQEAAAFLKNYLQQNKLENNMIHRKCQYLQEMSIFVFRYITFNKHLKKKSSIIV